MPEYIKRTDALRIVDEVHGARSAYNRIRGIPAADVAPVVRCKDCAWRGTAGCPYNAFDRRVERPDNGFCSDGERKENKYDPA